MKASSPLVAVLLTAVALQAAGESFSFSGDRMETVLTKGRERTLLSGNAWVSSGEQVIRAESMELYGKEFRYLRCSGGVRVTNEKKKIDIESRELFYDREDKVLQLQGGVVMTDRENELILKGGFLEHREEKEETLVQIGVRILKKDMVCRAEFARHLRTEDRLELSGMPMVNWKGDEYRAARILVDLKTDTIRLVGGIRGTVTSTEEEPPPPAGEETPPAPAAGRGETE